MQAYLGIDVGSVSTNIVLMNEQGEILDTLYERTQGQPIAAVQQGIESIHGRNPEVRIAAVGATGSGRNLAAVVVGADVVKNEITAHAIAAMHIVPEVRTIIEIGGQDSKLILIRDGVVSDFAMNTVCAAGTGSFLDQQAARLNIPVQEFGRRALESSVPVRIAGRCAVFAESDMIHKQQTGHSLPDIINGLCHALVRNYLNNLGKGKKLEGPVVFQGGVAANHGMRRAFEQALGQPVIVPQYYHVMGAIGSALLAREASVAGKPTRFRGFGLIYDSYASKSFECAGCPNLCEVIEVTVNGQTAARWGDRCGKWTNCQLTG
ncbi:MAG: acyl-CoA dehydratase activase [Negativicutes bacterium]|nr:acyl-CoA dehydratase activase [Negativicutes bacterium]